MHASRMSEQAQALPALALDSLLTVFAALDGAASLAEVCEAAANGLAREFPRVLVFAPRGNHLVCAIGPGAAPDASSPLTAPLAEDSVLTRAWRSGRLESVLRSCSPASDPTVPIDGTPDCAIAAPLLLQGHAVAVIYADDNGAGEFAAAAPQARLNFAELVRQHASLQLLRIQAECEGTTAPARRPPSTGTPA